MQGRSWMAALTLAASAFPGLVLGFGPPVTGRADDPKPTTAAAPAASKIAPPSKVRLDLRIVGLSSKGCDVEISPGHMGCRFRPVSLHLDQHEATKKEIVFEDVQTTGSDRYCIFSITVREPGQPVKTVHRGLRLVPGSSGRDNAQLLTCYLSSPSKLARTSEMRERR